MKLVEKKQNVKKKEGMSEFLAEMEQNVVFIYLFCMLGIFPLWYKQAYSKIGSVKFEFFWNVSLVFIGVSIIFLLIKVVWQKGNYIKNILSNLSFLDYAVLAYALCVILSYAFSDYKEFALKGAAGWEMGLGSQLIFIVLYFILSKQEDVYTLTLGVHLVASALTFAFGILHRFQIDPLGMYEGLTLGQKVEFLSTIGQATWFSSYICTVFAAGVILFYVSKKKWVRIVSGIYSVLSFAILVTQNSDSAFLALVGIVLLLGYFSLSDIEKWCRFWEIVCLMWGTFAGIGLLQRIFADQAIVLDTLSVFFSQSIVIWILLAVSLGIFFFYSNKKKQGNIQIMKPTKYIYNGILVLLVAAIIAAVILIYLNTKGYLLDWFGYQSTNMYLLFNDYWGNHRGFNWSVAVEGYAEMPFLNKLFGVGPDSFSEYLYNIPSMAERLSNYYTNLRLTNAHNEFLNSLVCYGIVGLVSWLTVLIGGIVYFYKKAKENPFMIAFALCIIGYVCHNIFCYQQVCCTPFLFIVLGIGECLTKSEKFNTIK